MIGRRAAAWAIGVVLAVGVFEALVLGVPSLSTFQRVPNERGFFGVGLRVASIGLMAALQAVFFWASFRAPRPLQVAYFVVFAAAVLVEYGYVKATGSLTTGRDVVVALENVRYWRPMAGTFFNAWALVPIGLYAGALVGAGTSSGPYARHLVLVIAVTVAVHAAYIANIEYGVTAERRGDLLLGGLPPAPRLIAAQAFFRSMWTYAWDGLVSPPIPARRSVAYRSPSRPTRHVVLVIDESIRADHLSVNGYSRPTTPWLNEIQGEGRLTNWGIAAAAANTSSSAVPCLLTGVCAFPDPDERFLTQPNVFDFAKAMNYQTHLFDAESARLRDWITTADLRSIDDWRNSIAFGDDPDTDVRMGREIARLLAEPTGQFIVALKRGDHLPFTPSFPRGYELADGAAAPPARPGVLTADYDRGLGYNIDAFFRAVLGRDGSLTNTTLLYTSDHAETLEVGFMRSVRWTTYAVPLMMFGDGRPVLDARYRASHANVFPTLLDLMECPSTIRPESGGRSLLTARAEDHDTRSVFTGDLLGHGPVVVENFDTLDETERMLH